VLLCFRALPWGGWLDTGPILLAQLQMISCCLLSIGSFSIKPIAGTVLCVTTESLFVDIDAVTQRCLWQLGCAARVEELLSEQRVRGVRVVGVVLATCNFHSALQLISGAYC